MKTTDKCDVLTGDPQKDAYLKFVYVFISLIGWQLPLIEMIRPRKVKNNNMNFNNHSEGESFLQTVGSSCKNKNSEIIKEQEFKMKVDHGITGW